MKGNVPSSHKQAKQFCSLVSRNERCSWWSWQDFKSRAETPDTKVFCPNAEVEETSIREQQETQLSVVLWLCRSCLAATRLPCVANCTISLATIRTRNRFWKCELDVPRQTMTSHRSLFAAALSLDIYVCYQWRCALILHQQTMKAVAGSDEIRDNSGDWRRSANRVNLWIASNTCVLNGLTCGKRIIKGWC